MTEDYQLSISANGYMDRIFSSSSAGLKIISGKITEYPFHLTPAIASISGRITDSNGQPVESAVISNNVYSTLSDNTGSWQLILPQRDVYSVSVAKIRYKTEQISNIDLTTVPKRELNNIALTSTNNPKVVFDNSKTALGQVQGDGIDLFNPLKDFLNQSNFVTEINEQPITVPDLQNVDVLVIASPSKSYTTQEIEAIKNFVKSGKKLIVLAEWGGYGGFYINTVDLLVQIFNLTVDTDTIRELSSNNYDSRGEYLIVNNFVSHPLLKDINTLAVYQACSVSVISGGIVPLDTNATKIIARSSNQGLRITSNGEYGVIGVSVYGTGKVVVIGDTSLWLSTDSNGDGRMNLLERDNQKFALNVFNW